MNSGLVSMSWRVVIGLLMVASNLNAAVTEHGITHESIAKALSDVKSLQQERQRINQEQESAVPVAHNLDMAKVNSSTEKSVFDGSLFEESLDQTAQQMTLFSLQITQLTSRYQAVKKQALQQMEMDKKQIEQLTKRVNELEKELAQTKQKLQQVQQSVEMVKSSTQQLTTLVLTNSADR